MVRDKDDIKALINRHKSQIAAYGAKSLGLFGSFAQGRNTADSDIDLLVEFEEGKKSFDNFVNLRCLWTESWTGNAWVAFSIPKIGNN